MVRVHLGVLMFWLLMLLLFCRGQSGGHGGYIVVSPNPPADPIVDEIEWGTAVP